jgi:hypothetical protein
VREKGGEVVEVVSDMGVTVSPLTGSGRGQGTEIKYKSMRGMPAMCPKSEYPVS